MPIYPDVIKLIKNFIDFNNAGYYVFLADPGSSDLCKMYISPIQFLLIF